MSVTDVQVHLWESERPDRPWPKPQQRPPHRPNGFGAEEMLKEMDAAGVDRAVKVAKLRFPISSISPKAYSSASGEKRVLASFIVIQPGSS